MAQNGGARPGAGGPTDLTQPLAEALLSALETSYYVETAARAVGISGMTLERWMRRGKKAIRHNLNGKEQPYADLYRRVQQTIAKKLSGHLGDIAKHGEKDWRALAWIVERADPERWGSLAPVIADLKARMTNLEKSDS